MLGHVTEPDADASLHPGFDTTVAHPARVYDYWLGGKDNFAADQVAAEAVISVRPTVVRDIRANRDFLGRAVRYLVAEAGIRQFLDIGTGLPATGSVHEVAQDIDPAVRVMYADNDPLVLTHAQALLTSAPEGRTAYIQADLRDPAALLASPAVHEVLDFSQPVGLILVAVLHFVVDEEEPARIVGTLLDALPSGSYLVASHSTSEHADGMAGSARSYVKSGIRGQNRDSGDFAQLAFSGLELVPPGVVLTSEWRPATEGPRPTPAEVSVYGGVARKP